MHAITCSALPSFGIRLPKNKAPASQTPVVPALGSRATSQQRVHHPGALSLQAGDSQVQNPFLFLTDAPTEIKNAIASSWPRPAAATPARPVAEEQGNELAPLGKPRFRSALEQVSFLTNESAMQWK